MAMNWQRVRVVVRADEADALGDALLEAGALSVEAADAEAGTSQERPIFAEPGADPATWARTEISALFSAGFPAMETLTECCANEGIEPAFTALEEVPEQDWVRLTQSQFEPVHVSDRLWIVPTWCEPPQSDAVVLRLDPGLAFGTGTHPTTRLCLMWLDRNLHVGETVLDYGCGSGILAIAAKLLGAERVTGVDVDPNAVRASAENARLNRIEARFVEPDADAGPPADVVVANILANPLRVLAPLIAGRCRPGGRIVLSGILEPQEGAVADAYSAWVDFEAPLRDDGWVCLSGRRR